MHISARADYAVRALLEIAASPDRHGRADEIVARQHMPRSFVEAILLDLRRAGLVHAVRSRGGGYTLAEDPSTISIGMIVRAVDGPLTRIRGLEPAEIEYDGAAKHLSELWQRAGSTVGDVLDHTSLQDVLDGRLSA